MLPHVCEIFVYDLTLPSRCKESTYTAPRLCSLSRFQFAPVSSPSGTVPPEEIEAPSSSPGALPLANSSPTPLSRPRATSAAAALAFVPAAAFAAATTEAELDDYFSQPHPEFAVALVIHWILWGKFDRRVALAYDFGGLVLFAAEPFFR